MYGKTKMCKMFFFTLCLVTSLFMSSPAHSLLITGSDWNGMDLIPGGGDSLSGIFTNVGLFRINGGSTVSYGTKLDIFANFISIYGSLSSNGLPGSSLYLNSNTDIYLAPSGSISASGEGSTLTFVGGSIVLDGSIITPTGTYPQDFGNKVITSGHDITVRPSIVPIPPSVILFGSAIAGLGLLRRRFQTKKSSRSQAMCGGFLPCPLQGPEEGRVPGGVP